MTDTAQLVAQVAQLAKSGVPLNAIPAILAAMNDTDLPKAGRRSRKGRFAPKGRAFGQKLTPEELMARDAETVAGFKRKGFNVTLMDRNDPAKPFDCRPFGRGETIDKDGNVVPATGWIGQGRVVRKGQHGVNGLFHISQTDVLPEKTS